MNASVYWMHLSHHNDCQTQGYVGVSKSVKERIRHHFKNAKGNYHSDKNLSFAIKKYGKENIKVCVLFEGSEHDCYVREKELRPKAFIGWNMREGGYHTPNPFPKGSKMPKEITEKAQSTIRKKRQVQSLGRDRKVRVNDVVYNTVKAAREAHGISSTQMKRYLTGFKIKSTKGNIRFNDLKIEYADH
jgi:hypothetical protein